MKKYELSINEMKVLPLNQKIEILESAKTKFDISLAFFLITGRYFPRGYPKHHLVSQKIKLLKENK